ncbi:hypothetical protein IMG5_119830 [Ichthyophthirius multifiliis]|uniref:Uncharacterized protein n=1 Tax=Ichthyophthirius multifiliis TaxID=5932 RepID=G0QUW3_ICHMU|nr:hypothetical protein IMG5_119830 [Ichthyophthirius multifiliis]EGR30968.1 hypothetical protein IMG5_119830 [Ichthyophthirius multifiliis]|eukprot:XP_004034435.1 hypothetical protein IMG5_119830 [Ichthyophthirius multifiliis]
MEDPEKKPLNKGGKGDDSEKKDPNKKEEEEKGCCDKFAACIEATCKFLYKITVATCNAIKSCLAFFWYPVKERCCLCIDNCDKKLNPWKDPSYTHV